MSQTPGLQRKVEDTENEAKSVHAKSARKNSINMLDEDEGEEELLTTNEEVEIDVAADSGAVAHTTGPKGLPGTVKVVRNRVRNFVGAVGEGIAHHQADFVFDSEPLGRVANLGDRLSHRFDQDSAGGTAAD